MIIVAQNSSEHWHDCSMGRSGSMASERRLGTQQPGRQSVEAGRRLGSNLVYRQLKRFIQRIDRLGIFAAVPNCSTTLAAAGQAELAVASVSCVGSNLWRRLPVSTIAAAGW